MYGYMPIYNIYSNYSFLKINIYNCGFMYFLTKFNKINFCFVTLK